MIPMNRFYGKELCCLPRLNRESGIGLTLRGVCWLDVTYSCSIPETVLWVVAAVAAKGSDVVGLVLE